MTNTQYEGVKLFNSDGGYDCLKDGVLERRDANGVVVKTKVATPEDIKAWREACWKATTNFGLNG
jgi:hypothetical protein